MTIMLRGFVALMALLALAARPARAAPEALVQTADGALAGTWQPGFRLFQGIPYAEPPVGALRWQPPQPAHSWPGLRPAAQPGNECVQQAIFWRPTSGAS